MSPSLILVHPVAGLGNTHHSWPSGWWLQNPSSYTYWCWDSRWLQSKGTHNPSLTPGAAIQFLHASPWLWNLAMHTLTWHGEWDYADTEWRKGLMRRCNKTSETGHQMQGSTRQAYWLVPISMPSFCFIPFSVYASFVRPCSPFPCSLPHQLAHSHQPLLTPWTLRFASSPAAKSSFACSFFIAHQLVWLTMFVPGYCPY